ncbi:ribose 5-phosphate isomerase B [Treponema sp. OMZ 840]|uniref:ribose 5-phosphate isomerase B n=1 Tax=Treponema sp. OMZ 840 TaxID=244313 RepID=UPI003D8A973E
MTIAIGCDEAAYDLKEELKIFITQLGHSVLDCGTFDREKVLYPDIAVKVANKIMENSAQRGILCCGTGIGMAMTANKIPGIRAAQCHDTYSAERAVKSNNAQIITMGARVIGIELAKSIAQIFLSSEFVDGPSTPKINKITEYDERFRLKGEKQYATNN